MWQSHAKNGLISGQKTHGRELSILARLEIPTRINLRYTSVSSAGSPLRVWGRLSLAFPTEQLEAGH